MLWSQVFQALQPAGLLGDPREESFARRVEQWTARIGLFVSLWQQVFASAIPPSLHLLHAHGREQLLWWGLRGVPLWALSQSGVEHQIQGVASFSKHATSNLSASAYEEMLAAAVLMQHLWTDYQRAASEGAASSADVADRCPFCGVVGHKTRASRLCLQGTHYLRKLLVSHALSKKT
jgi:hypothetical protein